MSLRYEAPSVRLKLNLTGIKLPFVPTSWVRGGAARLAQYVVGYSAEWALFLVSRVGNRS